MFRRLLMAVIALDDHPGSSSASPQLIDSATGFAAMTASIRSTQPRWSNEEKYTDMLALGHNPATICTSIITSTLSANTSSRFDLGSARICANVNAGASTATGVTFGVGRLNFVQ